MGLEVGLAAAQLGGTLFAANKASKKTRARLPQQLPIKDLVNQSVQAQQDALRGGIANLDQFGGNFITSQFNAQKQALPDFFRRKDQALNTGQSLVERLLGKGNQNALTEQIRASQAARGVALSPASALQEGIRLSQARTQELASAFGLQNQLTNLSSASPFGVQAFNPGIPGIGQLTGIAGGQQQQAMNLAQQGAFFGAAQQDASNAANASILGGRLPGQFSSLFDALGKSNVDTLGNNSQPLTTPSTQGAADGLSAPGSTFGPTTTVFSQPTQF